MEANRAVLVTGDFHSYAEKHLIVIRALRRKDKKDGIIRGAKRPI
jgi:hypothetical protein